MPPVIFYPAVHRIDPVSGSETAPRARIPDQELQRLKEDVSVQRLVEASGVVLKKAGKDWLGRCPFHDDAEASLVERMQELMAAPRTDDREIPHKQRQPVKLLQDWLALPTSREEGLYRAYGHTPREASR